MRSARVAVVILISTALSACGQEAISPTSPIELGAIGASSAPAGAAPSGSSVEISLVCTGTERWMPEYFDYAAADAQVTIGGQTASLWCEVSADWPSTPGQTRRDTAVLSGLSGTDWYAFIGLLDGLDYVGYCEDNGPDLPATVRCSY